MGTLSFLQPAFLFGALAIAIPILIHLISRRRAIRWPFAAMEFLLRSHRKVARRLKIKQFLLLLLRCLLIAGLAFAFAKPFLQRAQGSTPAQPAAYVIILDDSMSMRYQESPKGASLFSAARQQIERWIQRNLRAEDRIALLRATQRPQSDGLPDEQPEQIELTFEKAAILDKLRRWKPSYARSDLPAAILRAQGILQKQQTLRPHILLFSDLAQHNQVAFPKSLDQSIALRFFPIRPAKAPTNAAVLEIQIEPAPYAGLDAYQFTVFVRNLSPTPLVDLPLTLHLNETDRSKGFLSIPPWQIAQKRFVLQLPKAGIYAGYAAIRPDGLDADDRYYFAIRTRKRPAILVVNGDSRPINYLDEVFYLQTALRDEQLAFQVDLRSIAASLPPPSRYDVVILANVEKIPFAWKEQLTAFVKGGGGLLLTMGEQIRPDDYNQIFAELLPRPLRSVALAAQRPDGTGFALQRSFGDVHASHPIFRAMYKDGVVFQSARASKLMLVETQAQKDDPSEILWRLDNGLPILLERKIAKGRVMLLTTSIDRDWTDLPIRPFFQPWIQRLVTYLAGGARFHRAPSLLINERHNLRPPENSTSLQLLPPQSTAKISLRPHEQGFLFDHATKPGIYRFERDGKPLDLLPLCVNTDSLESDLRPLPDATLQQSGEIQRSTAGSLFQQSERLWPFILLLLILFFFSEALVLRFL